MSLPYRALLRNLAVPAVIGVLLLTWPDEALAECPVPPVEGVQPFPEEVSRAFDQAAANALGGRGPSYPKLRQGYPTYREVPATFSPTILKAIGYLESRWRQFRNPITRRFADWGEAGITLINSANDPSCAYGIMQIVSGMNGTTQFDPPRVAAEYAYNIGTGALILLNKWNYLAGQGITVGENNPAIMEDWYYAVWAYHYWGWLNNPNNLERFDPNRNPYWDPFDPSSYPASAYPYQELIWGYVANPPPGPDGRPLWQSIRLSFPDPAAIGYSHPPGHISDPQPTHLDSSQATPTPTPSPTATPVILNLPYKLYFPFINRGTR